MIYIYIYFSFYECIVRTIYYSTHKNNCRIKTTAAQSGVALGCRGVRGLCFLAVVFASTILLLMHSINLLVLCTCVANCVSLLFYYIILYYKI